jgi:integrase
MGQKNFKGTVSISKADGRIRLRWRYQGQRYSLNLFHYNKANISPAKRIALQMEDDMLNGNFDSTLNKYKNSDNGQSPLQLPIQKPAKETGTLKQAIEGTKTIVQFFEEWTRLYRQRDCEVDKHYYALRNNIKRWGDFDENNVLTKLNTETYSAKTYNERLTMLNAFSRWLIKVKIWPYNPFEDVTRRKVKKVINTSRKPFTVDEIKKILNAIKNDTYCPKNSRFTHSYYYPFIYFIFKTGVRNAEAVGLRVSNVNVTNKSITIKEVMARTMKGTNAAQRVRKETKNGKVRLLPLTADLYKVLKPLIEGKDEDGLVFISPKGLAIDDRMFHRRIFRPVLKALQIQYRVLYACRHTFNSRCIDAGMTPVMTAFLMGNNPETALRNYTHQLNIPKELPNI